MCDKTLVNDATLELTQKIQMHFPRGIDSDILRAWNGCKKEVLTARLEEIFGKMPNDTNPKNLLEYLRPLFEDEEIFIEVCDGSQTLTEASDVFGNNIDNDFKRWGLNKKGKATDKTPVKVLELMKDGSCIHFFGSLFGASPDGIKIEDFIEQNREDLRKYCFQQHQIKSFSVEHKDKLRKDGCATFFLFEEGNNFFVAHVYFNSDGTLYVFVRRLEHDIRWGAGNRHRVVVPQLAT